MKKIGLLFLALLIGFGTVLTSQEADTSKVRIGKKKYTIIVDDDKEVRIIPDDNVILDDDVRVKKYKKPKRRMDGTWGGLEFGLTNFVNSDYQLDLPQGGEFLDLKMGNSWGFNWNFAEKSLGIVRNYFGLVTGLGFEYQRYMFSDDFDLTKTDQGIVASPVDVDFYKNRLSICHLTLPLMAEVQIPVWGEHNRIKLSAGVIGGLRIGSRQVQKYMANDEKQKIRTRDDFYLRDFRYGFTARAGYGSLILFANYYPQTLFEEGMGPEVFPVTFGLHIGD